MTPHESHRLIEEAGQHQGLDLLLKVAHLFYVQDRTQKQIATTLRIHPSRVSRLIAEVRKRGFVHFALCPPTDSVLTGHLLRHLKGTSVRHVVVSPSGRSQVAAVAARYFEDQVGRSGMTVALDGGLTISELVGALRPGRFENVTIVPVAADPPSYAASAYELMTRLSVKYPIGVDCRKPPLHTEVFLQQQRQKVRMAAGRADAVLLAAGPLRANPTALEFMRHLGVNPKRIERNYRVVEGFCGYHAVNARGELVRIREVEDRMPRTLDFDQLVRMSAGNRCRTILVAASRHKLAAVASVVRAGMCNTLIADSELAAGLLRVDL